MGVGRPLNAASFRRLMRSYLPLRKLVHSVRGRSSLSLLYIPMKSVVVFLHRLAHTLRYRLSSRYLPCGPPSGTRSWQPRLPGPRAYEVVPSRIELRVEAEEDREPGSVEGTLGGKSGRRRHRVGCGNRRFMRLGGCDRTRRIHDDSQH